MKQFIIIIFFSILFHTLYAQQDTLFITQPIYLENDSLTYETDTLFFHPGSTKNILINTAILTWTQNQVNAMGSGLIFQNVTKSDCQSQGFEEGIGEQKINSIIETDSTIVVDINIYENCCYEFLCDIAVDSVGTLNLIYYGYGHFCACGCCFGLVYHFTKEKGSDYREIKGVMINGDKTTYKKIE